MPSTLPRMYTEFAEWWPVLSSPDDYSEEAEVYRACLLESATIPVHTVLELGSGGGNNASHLKRHFEMVLVDLSPAMLRVSRSLNPECEHVHGDMREVRLGRVFDAVLVHDAIGYMLTEEDLARAFATAWVHLKPGGAALFCPDWTTETYSAQTEHGGHDRMLRAMRYVEWAHEPEPGATTYITDFAFLLRDKDGVRVEHDRHVLGLFPAATWHRLLEEQGFAVTHTRLGDRPDQPGEVFIVRRS